MRYALRRLLFLLPILYTVSNLVFAFIHLIPGDPVDAIVGEQAPQSERQLIVRQLGLDTPLWEQQVRFMAGLLHGELGQSLFNHEPVSALIVQRFPATLQLALSALLLSLLWALPLGLYLSQRVGTRIDHIGSTVSLIGLAIPGFVLGPIMAWLFAVQLGWLPLAGRESALSFVLPALTLSLALGALSTRLIRNTVRDLAQEDYVRTARSKGLSERTILLKHIFPNALSPILTVIGLQFGALLAGSIVTEKIFSWPGIGSLLLTAIERRDYPVVQGCVLVMAVSYVLVNLLTDLLYARFDPRIRLGES